jgi:hypothetical protein
MSELMSELISKLWHFTGVCAAVVDFDVVYVHAPRLLCVAVLDFDVVYVRAPRLGDDANTCWPEVKDPIRAESGTDLILLRPDGSAEVLVAGVDGTGIFPRQMRRQLSSSVKSVDVSKSLQTRSLTHLKTILNRPIRSRESTNPTLESPKSFTVVVRHRTEADGISIFLSATMMQQLSSSV